MKITKTQLRRIIREEKALLSELDEFVDEEYVEHREQLKHTKGLVMTVIANLQDYGGQSVYSEGDEEILDQLELLYDINNSLASVLGMPGGTPG